jgi:hypothetical protein
VAAEISPLNLTAFHSQLKLAVEGVSPLTPTDTPKVEMLIHITADIVSQGKLGFVAQLKRIGITT